MLSFTWKYTLTVDRDKLAVIIKKVRNYFHLANNISFYRRKIFHLVIFSPSGVIGLCFVNFSRVSMSLVLYAHLVNSFNVNSSLLPSFPVKQLKNVWYCGIDTIYFFLSKSSNPHFVLRAWFQLKKIIRSSWFQNEALKFKTLVSNVCLKLK